MEELRSLSRGIAPPVLVDRGMEAALREAVARSVVPTTLTYDAPAALPAHIENAAYFVVSECLTNIAKHSGATAAAVSLVVRDGPAVVVVEDDGRGGAQFAPDGGLAGLVQRARAVDGNLVRHFAGRRPDGRPHGAAVRLVIADDSVLLREGLQLLLSEAGHDVVAGVGDGPSLVTAALSERPDLCIVDVRMPPSHTDEGLRAVVELRREWPEARVMVLSQYVELSYAEDLLADGRGGIGYLLKDRVSDVEDFVGSAERVAAWWDRDRSHRGLPARRPSAGPAGRAHPAGAGGAVPDGRGSFERRHRPRR